MGAGSGPNRYSLTFTWGDLCPQAPAHLHSSADLRSLKAVAYRGTKAVSFAHILGIPVGLASGHRLGLCSDPHLTFRMPSSSDTGREVLC